MAGDEVLVQVAEVGIRVAEDTAKVAEDAWQLVEERALVTANMQPLPNIKRGDCKLTLSHE